MPDALAAFAGVIAGKRVLHKITMATVQRMTGVLLLLIAVLLGLGVISGLAHLAAS